VRVFRGRKRGTTIFRKGAEVLESGFRGGEKKSLKGRGRRKEENFFLGKETYKPPLKKGGASEREGRVPSG